MIIIEKIRFIYIIQLITLFSFSLQEYQIPYNCTYKESCIGSYYYIDTGSIKQGKIIVISISSLDLTFTCESINYDYYTELSDIRKYGYPKTKLDSSNHIIEDNNIKYIFEIESEYDEYGYNRYIFFKLNANKKAKIYISIDEIKYSTARNVLNFILIGIIIFVIGLVICCIIRCCIKIFKKKDNNYNYNYYSYNPRPQKTQRTYLVIPLD